MRLLKPIAAEPRFDVRRWNDAIDLSVEVRDDLTWMPARRELPADCSGCGIQRVIRCERRSRYPARDERYFALV
jgi:hypothetical protein